MFMLVLCNAGCPWSAAIKSASESNKMPQKIIEMPSCSNQMLMSLVGDAYFDTMMVFWGRCQVPSERVNLLSKTDINCVREAIRLSNRIGGSCDSVTV